MTPHCHRICCAVTGAAARPAERVRGHLLHFEDIAHLDLRAQRTVITLNKIRKNAAVLAAICLSGINSLMSQSRRRLLSLVAQTTRQRLCLIKEGF